MEENDILERLEELTESAPDAIHEMWNLYAQMAPQEAGLILLSDHDPEWGLPERAETLGPDWMAAARANSPRYDPRRIFVMARCHGGAGTMEDCAWCELISADTPDELADLPALARFINAHRQTFFERWRYASPDFVSDDD